jgi:LAS superfamily LD-carboxypeptidase LdcB
VSEGAATLASTGTTSTTATTTTSTTGTAGVPAPPLPTPWLVPIWSPWGTMYLASGAAEAWNAMRDASLQEYGVDLYPSGTLSAYRSYDQQSYLYDLFLSGQGAPADPPGTSSHELGTAVDVATPGMRWVVDQIGAAYGWGKIHGPGEWWHVDYLG